MERYTKMRIVKCLMDSLIKTHWWLVGPFWLTGEDKSKAAVKWALCANEKNPFIGYAFNKLVGRKRDRHKDREEPPEPKWGAIVVKIEIICRG